MDHSDRGGGGLGEELVLDHELEEAVTWSDGGGAYLAFLHNFLLPILFPGLRLADLLHLLCSFRLEQGILLKLVELLLYRLHLLLPSVVHVLLVCRYVSWGDWEGSHAGPSHGVPGFGSWEA